MPRWQAPLKNANARSWADHLLRLARMGADEDHAAAAEADVRDFFGHRRAVEHVDFMALIELVGFAGAKLSGT
jgi:hypothetical protein